MEFISHFNTAVLLAGLGIFLLGLGHLFQSVSHLIETAGYSKKRK